MFTVDEKLNRDHVPPRACIAVRDKAQSPLILPTHPACNAAFKVDDERAGQFLSILHGKLAARENRRLKYKQFFAPGKAPVVRLGRAFSVRGSCRLGRSCQ